MKPLTAQFGQNTKLEKERLSKKHFNVENKRFKRCYILNNSPCFNEMPLLGLVKICQVVTILKGMHG